MRCLPQESAAVNQNVAPVSTPLPRAAWKSVVSLPTSAIGDRLCVCHLCVWVLLGWRAVVFRASLAPFDCTTRSGVSTMDADPSIVCDGTGAHGRMRVVAVVMVLGFALGVPCAFAAFLWTHRASVMADQALRARGEGDSELTNPHIRVRRRFRKLYEDYRPQLFAWKLVLLTRKLLFAMVVVLLNSDVLTQVALPCTTAWVPSLLMGNGGALPVTGFELRLCVCIAPRAGRLGYA